MARLRDLLATLLVASGGSRGCHLVGASRNSGVVGLNGLNASGTDISTDAQITNATRCEGLDGAVEMEEEKSCDHDGAPELCSRTAHSDCPKGAHLRCEGVLKPLRASLGVDVEPWRLIRDNIDIDLRKTSQKKVLLKGTPFELVEMSNDDFKTFKTIVTSYGKHMKKHKDSLLQRYLAIIKIHRPARRWVLRNRMFPIDFDVNYDLKGSLAKRSTSDGVMTDLAFKGSGLRIEIPSADQKGTVNALDEDTRLLKQLNLFDYSLMFSQMRFTMPVCHQRGRSRCNAPVCHGERCVDFSDDANEKQKQWQDVKGYFCGDGGHDRSARRSKNMDSCVASFSFDDGENTATVAFGCMGIAQFMKAGEWGKLDGFKDWFRRWGTKEATIQSPKRYQSRFYDFMRKAISKDGENQYSVDFGDPSELKRICKQWGRAPSFAHVASAIDDVELIDTAMFNAGDDGSMFKTVGLCLLVLLCLCGVGGVAFYVFAPKEFAKLPCFAGKTEKSPEAASYGAPPSYGCGPPQGQYGVERGQPPQNWGAPDGQQGDFGLGQPTQYQQQHGREQHLLQVPQQRIDIARRHDQLQHGFGPGQPGQPAW